MEWLLVPALLAISGALIGDATSGPDPAYGVAQAIRRFVLSLAVMAASYTAVLAGAYLSAHAFTCYEFCDDYQPRPVLGVALALLVPASLVLAGWVYYRLWHRYRPMWIALLIAQLAGPPVIAMLVVVIERIQSSAR